MTPLFYYHAKVVDNDDTNSDDNQKLARVQIRILPEMKDVGAKYLPWIKPFSINGMNVPQKNDYIITIFIDKFFRTGFYIDDKLFLENFFDYSTIETSIKKITEIGTVTYPDLKCRQYEDGTIEFHNISTGAHGVYHKSGAYQIIDPNGNIYLKDKTGNKISMNTTGIKFQPFAGKNLVLQTITSALWNPNILPNCIFTGAPHGGKTAGITDLKGS